MNLRETMVIDDAQAARAFRGGRQRKILLLLIDQDRSSSELSRLTGTPLSLMNHHLRRLLRLGLVRMTRADRRAGASIKFYRAVARRFVVPAEFIEQLPAVELAERLRRGLDAAIEGMVFFTERGNPRMQVVQAAGAQGRELWLELRMSNADAALLAAELRALVDRFAARSGGGRNRWLIHAALAPVR